MIKPPQPYKLELSASEREIMIAMASLWFDGTQEQKDLAHSISDKLKTLERHEAHCQYDYCYDAPEFVLQHREKYVACHGHLGTLTLMLNEQDPSFGPILVAPYDGRPPL